jgi:predicted O-methyltransferase YrrM
MEAAHYKTRPYKMLALASHAVNPGSWPFFADRIGRKLNGTPLRAFTTAQTEDLYGGHIYELPVALQALGLPSSIRDPRTEHVALFEDGSRRVADLDVPFQQLGIAGESDMRLIYSAALACGARDILETGVALGWSSLALLKAAEITDGQVVSVDLPYPFLIGDNWVGAAVPPELHLRWTLLKEADRSGIPKALRLCDGYDFIHYDSDKSPEGRNWAYPLLWAAVRPGGLLLSDDVGDNEAWAELCESISQPLIVVRRQNALAGIVRKPELQSEGARHEASR